MGDLALIVLAPSSSLGGEGLKKPTVRDMFMLAGATLVYVESGIRTVEVYTTKDHLGQHCLLGC